MVADDWAAVVADDRWVTVVADYDLAIAATWIDRAHDRRHPARSARFCERIDYVDRCAMIADDRWIAMVANDRAAMIANNRRVCDRRATGAVRRVTMVANDRRVAVISDDRWSAMIADYDLAIAAARVDRAHDRRRLTRTARLGMGIDDIGRGAMVADDWRVAVVANDRWVAVVSDDWRALVISNYRWSAVIADDGRV
jgi:hypothetical protein